MLTEQQRFRNDTFTLYSSFNLKNKEFKRDLYELFGPQSYVKLISIFCGRINFRETYQPASSFPNE